MIVCPKCNYDNELGRIFCGGCGEKLNLEEIKGPESIKKKRRWFGGGKEGKKLTPFKLVMRILQLCFWILVILVGYLAWQTPPTKGIPTSDADFESASDKLGKLVDAKRADELLPRIEFTESEIASWLEKKPEWPNVSEGFNFALTGLRLECEHDSLTIVAIITGNYQAHKKEFTFKFTGKPKITGGKLTFHANSVSVGKCPVPKFLYNFVMGRVAEFASRVDEELSAAAHQGFIQVLPGFIAISSEL